MRQEARPQEKLGSRVAKKFKGTEYRGTVRSYDEDLFEKEGVAFYLVACDDGDEEEFSDQGVEAGAQLFRALGSRRDCVEPAESEDPSSKKGPGREVETLRKQVEDLTEALARMIHHSSQVMKGEGAAARAPQGGAREPRGGQRAHI